MGAESYRCNMFRARLKHKNKFIDGYFIDLNGNIYDENGLRQETYINDRYQTFKKIHVHRMMVHSFYGYKPGYDVHHRNEIKTDNRLQNLVYLPRAEHSRLHKLGKTHSDEAKQKLRDFHLGKTLSAETKQKLREANLGKTFSEESKQKMSQARQDKKKVRCLESDIVYPSINAASRELNIHLGQLSQHLNNIKYKSVNGLHFQFVLE